MHGQVNDHINLQRIARRIKVIIMGSINRFATTKPGEAFHKELVDAYDDIDDYFDHHDISPKDHSDRLLHIPRHLLDDWSRSHH